MYGCGAQKVGACKISDRDGAVDYAGIRGYWRAGCSSQGIFNLKTFGPRSGLAIRVGDDDILITRGFSGNIKIACDFCCSHRNYCRSNVDLPLLCELYDRSRGKPGSGKIGDTYDAWVESTGGNITGYGRCCGQGGWYRSRLVIRHRNGCRIIPISILMNHDIVGSIDNVFNHYRCHPLIDILDIDRCPEGV